ncbi:MAG: Mrp/NBP35 family ATP-binding protein, partial [Flavobacterium sp.]|nr:Mrp/NBP35 family ATP-binding protein [Flavobacterium sp.]
MKLDRKEILTALETISVAGEGKNMVESGAVQNVITFGDEVVVDLLLSTPALHIKKRAEVDIIKVIHEKVYEKAKVKVNIKVEAPEKPENPNLIRGKQIPGISNIIAVASGKGGVGKSTITANLAVSLAKMGFKVGVLDADIYGPSMPIMFDVENSKPISVEVNGKSKMQPVSSYGVEILSIGFFTKPDQAVIWRGPMAAKALNQMIFDANWGELDFMLIDLPPGTGDIHLSIMQSLPITGAVVVSTPQAVALADAKKGVSMFMSESINVPVLGIIENMAYFTPGELPENKYYIFGKEGAKNLAEDLQVPLLGEVPLVQSIREAGDYGRPAALQTASVLEGVFETITRNVVQETVNRNEMLPPTE